MANHPIVHVEIPAKDTKAAGEFYSKLFDWKMQLDEKMNYLMFESVGGPGGGFTELGGEGNTKPGDVVIYVGTDDIEATTARAESLGAKVIMPKMEIPMTGWIAIFEDPTGNKIGLYKAMNPTA